MNHQNVIFGKNCRISPTAILENVVCGDNVSIGNFAELKNITIGSDTKIGGHVVMYSPDKEKPITIGRNVVVAFGTYGEATGGEIHIFDNASIAHRCTLLTSSDSPWSPELADMYPLQCGGITMRQHTWIGVACTVLPNVDLSEGIIVGAHSLIRPKTYKPWTLYGGTPCKELKPLERKIQIQ
jgi:acetyltransferase-like isoleucine patch superfamily enzyme